MSNACLSSIKFKLFPCLITDLICVKMFQYVLHMIKNHTPENTICNILDIRIRRRSFFDFTLINIYSWTCFFCSKINKCINFIEFNICLKIVSWIYVYTFSQIKMFLLNVKPALYIEACSWLDLVSVDSLPKLLDHLRVNIKCWYFLNFPKHTHRWF